MAASVPATEHSVMCVRGADGELETFAQILDVYPSGIVSAVSDGFDLFKVITETLPQLRTASRPATASSSSARTPATRWTS